MEEFEGEITSYVKLGDGAIKFIGQQRRRGDWSTEKSRFFVDGGVGPVLTGNCRISATQACPRSQVGCEMWRPGFLQTDNQPETALCTCKVLHPDASLGALPSAPMNELLYSFTDASLGALPLGILVAAFSSTHSHKELSDSWWSLPP